MGFKFSRWTFSIRAIRRASRSVNCRTIAGIVSSPASRAARNRRSPATIWNAPPEGRRSTGCSTPRSRIEVASSRMVVGSNWVLGCAGLRTIVSSATCWISPWRGSTVRSSGATETSRSTAEGMSDASPRPNAFLAMVDHLVRKVHVADRSGAARIVDDHGLPEAGRLAQSNVSWNDGVVDALREVTPGLVHYLLREIEAIVVHRQENPLDLERGVEPLLHQSNRSQQVAQSLERVVLALDRDENRARRRQC